MIPVIFINCTVEPYVDDIMSFLKQYETRTRNTLGRFLGERVLLAETGHGRPLVKCSAVIDQVVSVSTREEWEEYLEQTCIPVGSIHDWQPDTKVKWLYHLTDVRPLAPFPLTKDARRHGRTWAEYDRPLNNLTSVSIEYTGGNMWVYQAMYKGKYWVYGNLSGWLNAYTYEPFRYMDENNCGDAPEEYAVTDATDFPTWGDVLRSIVDQGEYDMDYVLSEMMYWNTDLQKRVNED